MCPAGVNKGLELGDPSHYCFKYIRAWLAKHGKVQIKPFENY